MKTAMKSGSPNFTAIIQLLFICTVANFKLVRNIPCIVPPLVGIVPDECCHFTTSYKVPEQEKYRSHRHNRLFSKQMWRLLFRAKWISHFSRTQAIRLHHKTDKLCKIYFCFSKLFFKNDSKSIMICML